MNSVLSSTSLKRKKSRTFAGCATCRQRKVKCDLRHPKCISCEKRGVECSGFGIRIQFLYYDESSDTFTRSSEDSSSAIRRRPLFSVAQQAAMSEIVSSAHGESNVDAVISCFPMDHLGCVTTQTRFRPFLCLAPATEIESTSITSCEIMEENSKEPKAFFDQDESLDEVFTLPAQSNFNFHMPQSLCDGHNLELVSPSPQGLISTYDDLPNSIAIGDFDSINPGHMPIIGSQPSQSWLMHITPSRSPPLQASFLLEHYSSQMVTLFSPRHSDLSPWVTLHLPSALSTFSELLVHGLVSPARVCFLHSLLSASAFNFDRVESPASRQSDFFWKLGDNFRRLANVELKQALALQLGGFNISKYKDVLMALLTMVSICVISGRQYEARSMLLDAEKLICNYGSFRAQKSRNIRLLHHTYLFVRIVEESTHLYPATMDVGFGRHVDLSESSLDGPFPSLKTHAALHGRNLDNVMGSSTHHALFGGSDPTSLFQDIYGIPLDLFSLLSRVSALANYMDICTNRPREVASDHEIRLRITQLEHDIHAWRTTFETLETSQSNETIVLDLTFSIYNAIIIYFYRRIHDVHPAILQPYVVKVLHHLTSIEQNRFQHKSTNDGMAWPAFIAAAEALDSATQLAFDNWLIRSASSSGFRNYDVAADTVEQVWQARQRGFIQTSWVTVVREKGIRLLLT